MKNSEKLDLLLREVQRLRDDVARIRRVEFVPYVPYTPPYVPMFPPSPVYPRITWTDSDIYIDDSVPMTSVPTIEFPSDFSRLCQL